MLKEASKEPWNVQELLKYSDQQKPQSSHILKNLERAKQADVIYNPKAPLENDDDDDDDERISRLSTRSKEVSDPKKPGGDKFVIKKDPQPLLQKPKNSETFAATGQRLAKLESLCRNQREEIKAKSLLIEKLYQEAILNKKKHEDESNTIKAENKLLKQKLEKIMKYIKENNIEWDEDREDKDYHKKHEKSFHKTQEHENEVLRLKGRLPKEIDIILIKKRVEDLNKLLEGEQEIVKDNDGAYKFKRRDPLGFAVYEDGLKIEGYPFYKYSQKEAQVILEDILDGYFPSILREKFPEGTPFELFDEVEKSYQDCINSGEKKPKERAHSEMPRANHLKFNQDSSNEKIRFSSKKSKEFFIDPHGGDTIEIHTTNVSKGQMNSDPDHLNKILTLKIRTETGKKTIILKALPRDTIDLVYSLIKNHSETKAFELWGGYPPQSYPNIIGNSLETLDIYGESVFNLRPVLYH